MSTAGAPDEPIAGRKKHSAPAGCRALSLLARPLNVQILEALVAEPIRLPDLRQTVGHPPATTMRSYLQDLTELGVIERHQEEAFPGRVSYAITRSGEHLLKVARVLKRWLDASPQGPVELGGSAAERAVRTFVAGWEVGIVRALAARPLALTELDRMIPSSSYPVLERRLRAMRHVGLIGPAPSSDSRIAQCRATPWLRQAMSPLAAAAAWEGKTISEKVAPPTKSDVEGAFLLMAPLLDLPQELRGICCLTADIPGDPGQEAAGAMVAVREGKVSARLRRAGEEADARIAGSVIAWLDWLRTGDGSFLKLGGDVSLASAFRRSLAGNAA